MSNVWGLIPWVIAAFLILTAYGAYLEWKENQERLNKIDVIMERLEKLNSTLVRVKLELEHHLDKRIEL